MGEAMPSLRRDYLSALGIEPLVLRAAGVGDGASDRSPLSAAESSPSRPVATHVIARLQLRAAVADPFAGPHAALLRGVVRALGLDLEEVCFEPRVGLPVLAFDDADASAQVHAPTLAALCEARAKRALWPSLRRLRGRLRRHETTP